MNNILDLNKKELKDLTTLSTDIISTLMVLDLDSCSDPDVRKDFLKRIGTNIEAMMALYERYTNPHFSYEDVYIRQIAYYDENGVYHTYRVTPKDICQWENLPKTERVYKFLCDCYDKEMQEIAADPDFETWIKDSLGA